MCLAIPGHILSIDKDTARVAVLGTVKKANISLLEEVSVGMYVLIHAGFAIERIDTDEAQKTLALIEEL